MDGELSAMEKEYGALKKKANALRNQLWPQPTRRGGKWPAGPGIVKQIRGEMQLSTLDGQMDTLREEIKEIIEVAG